MQEIEDFLRFFSTKPVPASVSLCPGQTIKDVEKFLEEQFVGTLANPGRRTGRLYLDRLQLLRKELSR